MERENNSFGFRQNENMSLINPSEHVEIISNAMHFFDFVSSNNSKENTSVIPGIDRQ